MKSTFTLDYNLTIDGEPRELLEKLKFWIENKFYTGRVDRDSFVIKEREQGIYEKLTDSTHIELVTTIEGQIQNDKRIKLSAELNTGHKIQAYLLRTFIVFFGLALAIASLDWFYSTLTVFITTLIYYLINRSIRKRIKQDLDSFIWTINTKTSTPLK
jgi:Flp pilus assembly protein TadB